MKKNILFCYSRVPSFTNAVKDYVDAFGKYSRHSVHYFDMDSGPLDFDLSPFDGIVFNYCFWARCLAVDENLVGKVRNFNGLKIAIFQDEYDYFLWHKQHVCELGIDVLVTCVPPEHWSNIFCGSGYERIELIHALTGYVPESLLNQPAPKSFEERRWWIGYRGRPVPFRYGRLTQEKVFIAEGVGRACAERNVPANIDVTEKGRIYGTAWTEFIRDCRVVLGTESGSNVFDFDGRLAAEIDSYLNDHPDADFETVHRLFLEAYEGKIQMNQISPRIFEAVALGTGLVLFEGDYSGVIQPWEHYIPLKKDFSNMDEVLAAIENTSALKSMTQRAYEQVIASGKYDFRTYVGKLDDLIDKRVPFGKGFSAVYGLIAWRPQNQKLVGMPHQALRLPTEAPLQHTDHIPDPVFQLRVDWSAAYRRFMRIYTTALYSKWGKRTQLKLQRYEGLYASLRWGVRRLTGRR